MKDKHIRLLGLVSFILGIFLLLNAKIGITGAIIGTAGTSSVFSLILGLVFVIVGIGTFIISERRKIESKIEQLVSSGVPISQIDSIQEGIRDEYRRMSKEKRKAIYKELAGAITEVRLGNRQGGIYELHPIKIIPGGLTGIPKGTRILEADAKVLSRYANQGGAGTERYIFNNSTGDLMGIAYHPRGDATELNWRRRF